MRGWRPLGTRGRAYLFWLCVGMAAAWGEAPLAAQVNGDVSVMADTLPNAGEGAVEMRTRLSLERRQAVGEHVRLVLSGHVDGLVADRAGDGTARDAVVRPDDLYADFVWPKLDLRVGASRIVWGRLDEFQPTDVVNPLDLGRLLLEGRNEARLAVGLARARVFLPRSSTLEAIVVPVFTRGWFDQLDEPTSPFNLLPPVRRDEPAAAARNMQGGARFTSTAHRVDFGISVYRGFRAFPELRTVVAPAPEVVASYPRYTMIGGDFETTHGAWGLRGEVATFDDTRRTYEGGVGVDRKAGDYRLALNVLLSRATGTTNTTLVTAAERTFARETRRLRALGVYDPSEQTGFVRAIGAISVRDNAWLEGSVGVFAGSSLELLGRFTDRDFVYVRLKVYF